MVWYRRVLVGIGVNVALIFAATAASAQVTYSLAGVETSAEPTEGVFVGVAKSPDDFGTWQARVEHDPLNDPLNYPTPMITGGSFTLDGQVSDLTGVITGGTIERKAGSCRRETFTVTATVALDGITAPGVFTGTLTHYGRRVPGGDCITFFATIEGLFTYTP